MFAVMRGILLLLKIVYLADTLNKSKKLTKNSVCKLNNLYFSSHKHANCRLPSWTLTEPRTKSIAARAKQHELTKKHTYCWRLALFKEAFARGQMLGMGGWSARHFHLTASFSVLTNVSGTRLTTPPQLPLRLSSCISNLPGRSKQHTTWTRSIIFRPPACDVRGRPSDWRRPRGKENIHLRQTCRITSQQVLYNEQWSVNMLLISINGK